MRRTKHTDAESWTPLPTDRKLELVFEEGSSFRFADAFAGIGGFHAALAGLGGKFAWASEIDPYAAAIYKHNWGHEPTGDIVPQTPETGPTAVPDHELFAGGFPCQPFSKSGFQRGINETRGTLFWNILRVLEDKQPQVVILENVRNLAGPRQKDTFDTIIKMLRGVGYRVASDPAVFSPHLLPQEQGGAPQVRDRVFITGTWVGPDASAGEKGVGLPPLVTPKPGPRWNPQDWRIDDYLDHDFEIENLDRYLLTDEQQEVIEVWNDFLRVVDRSQPLPGFPIWADAFQHPAEVPDETPAWKANFLRKNAEYYRANQRALDKWLARHNNLRDLAPSRRKLEWQAQDTDRNLWNCVLHFRPSGIRAKKPTYLPAMVAITQTSIIGPRRRRITPTEGLRLQGLPSWYSFHNQPEAQSYKQLGNGVNSGVVQYVLRQHALRDEAYLPTSLFQALTSSPRLLPQPAWHTLDLSGAIDLTEVSEAAPLSL